MVLKREKKEIYLLAEREKASKRELIAEIKWNNRGDSKLSVWGGGESLSGVITMGWWKRELFGFWKERSFRQGELERCWSHRDILEFGLQLSFIILFFLTLIYPLWWIQNWFLVFLKPCSAKFIS
jgi:hypothetical protein